MSQILDEVLAANAQYASTFDKDDLPVPPARHIAILTCMDARLDPHVFAGLQLGDAHIIRNAGGRASDDAIRSLLISYKLLGTREWFVIHHTECGLEAITDEQMWALFVENYGTKPTSIETGFINWLTIADRTGAVVDDVARLRNHPLVPGDIIIYGYLYDVRTGKLVEVLEATEAGKPTV